MQLRDDAAELAERLKAAEALLEWRTSEFNSAVQHRKRVEAQRDELVEALRELLFFDFHASQHAAGNARVIPGADVDKFITAQNLARDALAKVKEGK